MCFWSESATTLRQDWTNTCVLEPCKNDASEREERKSPNPGKRSAKRSVRVYAANCDCVTCVSKFRNELFLQLGLTLTLTLLNDFEVELQLVKFPQSIGNSFLSAC